MIVASIQRVTVNYSSRTKLTGDIAGSHGIKNEGSFPAALQYKNDSDSGAIVGTIVPAGYVYVLAPGETIYMHLEDGSGAEDDLCASCIIDSNTTTIRIWSAF